MLQPADEIGHVALALAQIRVGHFVEHGAELVEDLLDRPLGVDPLFAHQFGRARHEHRIVEHQQLRVEERGQLAARAGAPPARGCRCSCSRERCRLCSSRVELVRRRAPRAMR